MSESEAPGANWTTELTAHQTEFPMRVAVCAWCKPKERGEGLGAISHGICLRHLRKVRMDLLKPARQPKGTTAMFRVRCGREFKGVLEEFARVQGVAVSEVVEAACREYVAKVAANLPGLPLEI
jgi:hypothetical protein